MLEHLETAYNHQIRSVGFGMHGEFRMLSGDWSDGEGQNGSTESTQSTAQAAWIFPLWPRWRMRRGSRPLPGELRPRARGCVTSWHGLGPGTGSIVGIKEKPVRHRLPVSQRTALGDPVRKRHAGSGFESCRAVQRLLERSVADRDGGRVEVAGLAWSKQSGNGSGTTGGVWFALNGPAIWGLAAASPSLAYRRQGQHARRVRAGISGQLVWGALRSGLLQFVRIEVGRPAIPAVLSGAGRSRAPVAVFDTVKLSGVQPTQDGYTIAPHWPFAHFSWESAVVGVTYDSGSAHGYIRPVGSGGITMRVALPRGAAAPIGLRVSGRKAAVTVSGRFATWRMNAAAHQEATWRLGWWRGATPASTPVETWIVLGALGIVSLLVIALANRRMRSFV